MIGDAICLYSQSNTYAVVSTGTYTFRTRTHNNAGRHPEWDETFEFPLTTERMVEFSIYNEGPAGENFVCSATFDLEEICGRIINRFSDCIWLRHKGGNVGKLHLVITYYENPWYLQQLQAHALLQDQQLQNLRCILSPISP